jgi:hypothetical protein
MFGDVTHPQPVGSCDREDTIDEIVGRLRVRITSRAAAPAAPIDALHAGEAHEAGDTLATDVDPGA